VLLIHTSKKMTQFQKWTVWSVFYVLLTVCIFYYQPNWIIFLSILSIVYVILTGLFFYHKDHEDEIDNARQKVQSKNKELEETIGSLNQTVGRYKQLYTKAKEDLKTITPQQMGRRQQMAMYRFKKDMEKKRDDLDYSKRELGLSFKELSLDRQAVYNERKEHAMDMRGVTGKIKKLLHDLSVARDHFTLEQREKDIQLLGKNINLLQKTLELDHRANIKDIEFRERESGLNLRDKKYEIKQIFDQNKNTLQELSLIGKSNRLDKRSLELDGKDLKLQEKESSQKLRDEEYEIRKMFDQNKNTLQELGHIGKSNQLDRRSIYLDSKGLELKKENLEVSPHLTPSPQ